MHLLTCPHLPGLTLVRAEGSASAQPRHAHDSLVLGVVLAGSRRVEGAGQAVLVEAGAGFAIAPGLAHACAPGPEGRCSYLALSLEPAACPVAPPGPLPLRFEDAELTCALRNLAEAMEGVAGALERQSLLAECLERLAGLGCPSEGNADEQPVPEALAGAVLRAKEILAQGLEQGGEGTGLAGLAEACGAGPYALHRAFTRVVGLPPHAFQTHLRLRRAKALLRGGASPSEAAQAAGFCDQSHLNRHFARLVGLTPAQYARAFGEGKG